jgi:DNA (cytosine-5)-methyltransferase 1
MNHPDADVVRGDVGDVDWTGVTADVVVGGPPCQGFSTLGRRDDSDPRNLLYQALLQCVQRTEPDVVLVENVARFLDVKEGVDLLESLASLGYHVRSGVLDAAAFGTPQKRRRALVAAARPGVAIPWPVESHGSGLKPLRTVADAFAMLPRIPDGKNWHISNALSPEYVERVRAIPPGGSRVDLPDDLRLECWRKARGHSDVMGRLRWSKPANTLRTEFHRPEKGRFLHPSEDRSISIREGARLQGFPDSYQFPEDVAFVAIARQVGNALPVTLARALGRAVITSLTERMPNAASF